MKQDKLNLFEVSNSVFKRYGTLGYDHLSYPEQVFVCVWGLEGEVDNGGFDQYYFNTSGDHALDTVASLDAIGANRMSNLVRHTNGLFGQSGPSPDRDRRQKQLDALDDAEVQKMNELEEEFFKYPDDLNELLTMYVARNAEAFGLK